MDDRVSEMYSALLPCLESLSGIERSATESILWDFCWFHIKVDDLQRTIDAEGLIVETPRGPKDNPCVAVLHKFEGRKTDIYSKLVKTVSRAGGDAVDRLTSFVSR